MAATLGSAALADTGAAVGDVPVLVDVGGVVGLRAVSAGPATPAGALIDFNPHADWTEDQGSGGLIYVPSGGVGIRRHASKSVVHLGGTDYILSSPSPPKAASFTVMAAANTKRWLGSVARVWAWDSALDSVARAAYEALLIAAYAV